jgi:hypothetical protein
MGRRFAMVAAGAGMATLLAGVVPATADAAAKPINKSFTFSKKHQHFQYGNSAGKLSAQIGVSKATVRRKHYPMPWSFVIAPGIASLATGKATCKAGNLQIRGYSDTHVVWPGYIWHSTVKPHKTNKSYTLWGSCKFPVRVGGRPGIATVSFSFKYRIVPKARAAAAQATSTTTTSKIVLS